MAASSSSSRRKRFHAVVQGLAGERDEALHRLHAALCELRRLQRVERESKSLRVGLRSSERIRGQLTSLLEECERSWVLSPPPCACARKDFPHAGVVMGGGRGRGEKSAKLDEAADEGKKEEPKEGGGKEREEKEVAVEKEEEEEQQQQQEEARVSPRASSRAEGPSQPPTDERSENGGDGWRKRATSVVMAHFRYVRISSQSLSPWMQACKGSELSQRRLFTPLSMSTRTGLSSKAFRTARPAAARALATALKISCAWLALTCAANLANACC